MAGRLIKTLVNEEQLPRQEGYTAIWDGTNDSGRRIATGVYFARLVAKGFSQAKKIVLLK
jgi:hypothetical protein